MTCTTRTKNVCASQCLVSAREMLPHNGPTCLGMRVLFIHSSMPA